MPVQFSHKSTNTDFSMWLNICISSPLPSSVEKRYVCMYYYSLSISSISSTFFHIGHGESETLSTLSLRPDPTPSFVILGLSF